MGGGERCGPEAVCIGELALPCDDMGKRQMTPYDPCHLHQAGDSALPPCYLLQHASAGPESHLGSTVELALDIGVADEPAPRARL